jgi:hypothetical protein
LEWQHGDDPWVKLALADYRKRGDGKPTDPEATLKKLREFAATKPVKPIRQVSPWPVVSAVKQLLEQKKFAEAREVAAIYHDLARRTNQVDPTAFASHLLYLIDQADPRADAP